ncbi:hypothetical protein CBOM_01743 [Ceraceosorus bombacis]|uniref:Uncharacterized protein n=1 Tax=Ceraceosorus bombacis TaxID=401625 RepID=A0A0P1BEG4_9BASI|nr:hypothetical protein CBOM_01743 [Ceraceosorus bombacis]
MGPNGTPPLSELRAAANASPIQYLKMQETAARRDTHLSFFGRRSQHETCEDVVEANLPLFARDAAPPVIQSIGAAICDLFDPTSLEADVLAQHSLIYNSFELRPVTKPFDKELPVTLQHFRLVMLQSAAIPAIFFNQIIAGCPFKVNWHASTNMPDMELLNRAAAATGISDDIRNQIAALAISSQKEETQIDIEVSGTYQSILIKRACFEPSEMKRPDIIKPSPTSLPQQDAAREPQEKYEQLSAGFDSPADRQSPLSSLEASALSVMSDSASSSSFKSGTSDTSHFYFGRFENKPIRISRSKSTELLKGLELWIKHLDALLKLESHRVEILQSIGASDGSSDGPRWRSARNKREPFQNQAQVALKRGVQRLKRYRKALIAAKKCESAKARRRSRASLPKRKCEQSQSDADADEPSTSNQLRPESSAKSRAKRASKRAKLKGDPYESSSLSSLGED